MRRLLFLLASCFALVIACSAFGFSQVIVFGDSLSDDGNVAHRVRDVVGFSYPSTTFDYSNYRFTDDFDTYPASKLYHGTWHEQLEQSLLQLPVATNSLDGGNDYAFGGATTQDGTQQRTVVNNPSPIGNGSVSVTIDNMGQQVADYLAAHRADPNALYIIWGGGNDLLGDDSSANVTATAGRIGILIQRLANAGARSFLIPNLPPLGETPSSLSDAARALQLDVASVSFRNQLNSAIASTKASLASHQITINVYMLDNWLNGIRVLGEPATYGFANVVAPSQAQFVNPDQYLFWDNLHPTTAGHREIADQAYRSIMNQIPPQGHALNISARAFVGTGEDALINGFIITGTSPKTVIIRALGPTLANFGVTGVLADPTLTIYNSAGQMVAANDNWRSTQQSAIAATGLAPTYDSESAIIATLPPGSYTAVAQGKDNTTGIALVDLYDLTVSSSSIISNLSTRSYVGTGDNVLIGGLIIGVGEPPVVVLRAIGPTLSRYAIVHPLADPMLELHDANGSLIAANDNWQDTQAGAVRATLLAPSDPREAAIVAPLSAGNYTAIVRGKNATSGVALIEADVLQ
ncbi:MAG: SGNH/GDSL hydrolase family protein [Verrucomicrobia bacterium]|nr:SGNH/GDSL hydrolase family protein [Verrucomicrobiota bacterium]